MHILRGFIDFFKFTKFGRTYSTFIIYLVHTRPKSCVLFSDEQHGFSRKASLFIIHRPRIYSRNTNIIHFSRTFANTLHTVVVSDCHLRLHNVTFFYDVTI